mmetsp:Transcript_21466/g.31135  ORF Transcript_21466/g.31135 Transcript_21466/m.31135 type:complete len:636 (-) Transcript_21466:136-2043(-)
MFHFTLSRYHNSRVFYGHVSKRLLRSKRSCKGPSFKRTPSDRAHRAHKYAEGQPPHPHPYPHTPFCNQSGRYIHLGPPHAHTGPYHYPHPHAAPPFPFLANEYHKVNGWVHRTKKFFHRRRVLLLLLTLVGGGYALYKYYPEVTDEISFSTLKPIRLVDKEKLSITSMNDTLGMYRYSIQKATVGENAASANLKASSTALQKSLSRLSLTEEQKATLEKAEEEYMIKNASIVEDLVGHIKSADALGVARAKSLDDEPDTSRLNLRSRKQNIEDKKLERLIHLKVQLDMEYMRKIAGSLSYKQYNAWRDDLITSRDSLMPWVNLLSSSPVAIPSAKNRAVYVLHFKGDISASQVSKLRREITGVLETADRERGDEVVVVLDSGGGTVGGYGLGASQLERIKAAGLHLTVCVDEVAASGGYMMASVADKIIASPFATLGSIGVISVMPNFYERLRREGIEVQDVTAGKYKRTLTPYRKSNGSDRRKLQQELEQVHSIFKRFVTRHRPNLNIKEIATGETWLGFDALQKGLCDELKTSDDVLLQLAKEGADVYKVSYSVKPTGLAALLRQNNDDDFFGPSESMHNSSVSMLVQGILSILGLSTDGNSSIRDQNGLLLQMESKYPAMFASDSTTSSTWK